MRWGAVGKNNTESIDTKFLSQLSSSSSSLRPAGGDAASEQLLAAAAYDACSTPIHCQWTATATRHQFPSWRLIKQAKISRYL
uniref:Uncharacterized protein n=1 Tax=Oryza rufipogon TaxID=4529 RepID=A0A0E0NLQ1_ORYRU